MISVIICSRSRELLATLSQNILETIGTDYEILATSDLEGKGIGWAYNCEVEKCNYEYICFMHEDIIIHTKGWGKKIVELLSQPEIGLVGVSGAFYKSSYSGTWATAAVPLHSHNTIQHFKNTPVNRSVLESTKTGFDEVVVIDGVFMATRRNVFENHRFDDNLLKGFHCYDIDLTLNIGSTYKIVVSKEILLEHFSEGELNREWLKDTNKLHKKWKNVLPKKVGIIPAELQKISDYQSCRNMLAVYLKYKGHRKEVIQYFTTILWKYFSLNKLLYAKKVAKYLFDFSR